MKKHCQGRQTLENLRKLFEASPDEKATAAWDKCPRSLRLTIAQAAMLGDEIARQRWTQISDNDRARLKRAAARGAIAMQQLSDALNAPGVSA